MGKGKDVTPITNKIFDRLLEILKGAPSAVIDTVKAAHALIVDETDDFVRNGNRTDYRRDGLAASSAKVEPLLEPAGKFALTYSTMKGRRVDDILYALLDFVSTVLYPPVERADANKTGPNAGKPKMNSRIAERNAWLDSIGYRVEVSGKGKRTVFGDQFAELKAELERLIPERFEGTEQPTLTNFQNLPLSIPASLNAGFVGSIYLPVAREGAPEELVSKSVARLRAHLMIGYTFVKTSKTNKMSPLSEFYNERVNLVASADAEQAKREARKAKRTKRPTVEQPTEVVEASEPEQQTNVA